MAVSSIHRVSCLMKCCRLQQRLHVVCRRRGWMWGGASGCSWSGTRCGGRTAWSGSCCRGGTSTSSSSTTAGTTTLSTRRCRCAAPRCRRINGSLAAGSRLLLYNELQRIDLPFIVPWPRAASASHLVTTGATWAWGTPMGHPYICALGTPTSVHCRWMAAAIQITTSMSPGKTLHHRQTVAIRVSSIACRLRLGVVF